MEKSKPIILASKVQKSWTLRVVSPRVAPPVQPPVETVSFISGIWILYRYTYPSPNRDATGNAAKVAVALAQPLHNWMRTVKLKIESVALKARSALMRSVK